jgi:hypothetical protein
VCWEGKAASSSPQDEAFHVTPAKPIEAKGGVVMKAVIHAASLLALLVAVAGCQRGPYGGQSATHGAGYPAYSNPTTDTTVGTSSGTAPPGANGTLVPGNQNSGSTTGQ